MRPRPAPLGLAFVLSAVWFIANVRRVTALDVLPFAWMVLTLWLALSIAFDLGGRYAAPLRRRR